MYQAAIHLCLYIEPVARNYRHCMWRKEEGGKAWALAFSLITHSSRSTWRWEVIFFHRGQWNKQRGRTPSWNTGRGRNTNVLSFSKKKVRRKKIREGDRRQMFNKRTGWVCAPIRRWLWHIWANFPRLSSTHALVDWMFWSVCILDALN